jgi:NADPH-dependent glutamate synthase beta subunit-like oxidoreductase
LRPREYCTGWARTGAKGLIATQKVGSAEMVSRMLEDYAQEPLPVAPRGGRSAMRAFLEQRQIRRVAFSDWQTIDAVELQRGQARGALRSKIVAVPEMMELVELQRLGL